MALLSKLDSHAWERFQVPVTFFFFSPFKTVWKTSIFNCIGCRWLHGIHQHSTVRVTFLAGGSIIVAATLARSEFALAYASVKPFRFLLWGVAPKSNTLREVCLAWIIDESSWVERKMEIDSDQPLWPRHWGFNALIARGFKPKENCVVLTGGVERANRWCNSRLSLSDFCERELDVLERWRRRTSLTGRAETSAREAFETFGMRRSIRLLITKTGANTLLLLNRADISELANEWIQFKTRVNPWNHALVSINFNMTQLKQNALAISHKRHKRATRAMNSAMGISHSMCTPAT